MSAASAVLLIALIVAVGALARAAAERVRIPVSIAYAVTGLAIAFLAARAGGGSGAVAEGARTVAALPIGSSVFLHALLPILLFQGALGVDLRRMREDALPILLLAIVAVIFAIFGIGLALWPFAGLPLVGCLLLAAVVATTDPVAVISIFRSVGAPERLARLVEGESLINDAAAVSFFLAFVAMIADPGPLNPLAFAADLLLLPVAGALLGVAIAWGVLHLPRRLIEDRIALGALTLALPFLAFWVAESLHVSGILAVVAAGVTVGTMAPGRVPPLAWRTIGDVWELLGESATMLVFVLTALLVPRLIQDWHLGDLGLLLVLFVAALAARAAILLGVFPLLAAGRLIPEVPQSYRIVALWGGLRGSMTLVLALAVTETEALPAGTRGAVAALAATFTLATLFVQGLTLRPLIERLGLNRLSGVDLALRNLVVSATRQRAADRMRDMAERLGSAQPIDPLALAEEEGDERGERLQPAERLAIGLAGLTAREREIVLRRFDAGLVEPWNARRLLGESRRRLDVSRLYGAEGYQRANATEVAFGPVDRAAVRVQRGFGLGWPLARRLARRYETLLETALVLHELRPFAEEELRRILGNDVAEDTLCLADARAAGIGREIAALRLQYPGYAAGLERLVAARAVQSEAVEDIRRMHRTGVIGAEVQRELIAAVERQAVARQASPALDLGLRTSDLIAGCPLLATLPPAARAELEPLMRPFFAAPGDRIIIRGAAGDNAAYFLSSGAVEVDTGAKVLRLGRGAVFGELALLFDLNRQADVTAIAFSSLLYLSADDFAAVLARHPALRAELVADGRRRLAENASGAAQLAMTT